MTQYKLDIRFFESVYQMLTLNTKYFVLTVLSDYIMLNIITERWYLIYTQNKWVKVILIKVAWCFEAVCLFYQRMILLLFY